MLTISSDMIIICFNFVQFTYYVQLHAYMLLEQALVTLTFSNHGIITKWSTLLYYIAFSYKKKQQ